MAAIAARGDRTSGDRPGKASAAIDRAPGEDSPLTLRIGFWAAVVATLGAIGFAVGIVLNVAVISGPTWTGDIDAYARGYSTLAMAVTVAPSLAIVPAYVALVGSLYAVARIAKRPIVLIALAFACVYAAIVGTNYFLQLIVVRQNLVSGNTGGMALLIMPNTHSIFWTLEFLGYFWQGVAAGFLALALGRGRLELWIRWLFAAVFVAGAIGIVDSILGVTSFTDPLMIAGTAPWLVAFPAATALCAIHLRRQIRSLVTTEGGLLHGDRR